MKSVKFLVSAASVCLFAAMASAGWNDRSPVITPRPSPYQPCDKQCMRDQLKGWNDRSPEVTPHPAPYQPCDRKCMIDSMGGWNNK